MSDSVSNTKYRHTAALAFHFFTRQSSGTADVSLSKVSSSVSISVLLFSISLSGSIFTVACAHGCVRMRMQCITGLQYYCLLQMSAIQISSSSKIAILLWYHNITQHYLWVCACIQIHTNFEMLLFTRIRPATWLPYSVHDSSPSQSHQHSWWGPVLAKMYLATLYIYNILTMSLFRKTSVTRNIQTAKLFLEWIGTVNRLSSVHQSTTEHSGNGIDTEL